MAATLQSILAEFREIAISKRDLGDRFERLILNYLKVDPLWGERFDAVWMWMDYPGRRGQPDTGIDLVARERATGDYCAIQCKFYDPGHTLDKSDIDSFFTASGTSEFSSRIIVSTTDRWGKHAIAACERQQIPVTRLSVKDLEESPIDWSTFSSRGASSLGLQPKKSPRPHQVDAIARTLEGFQTDDRGKLIMACGTGKTFTALKIAEAFADRTPDTRPARVLFLVPSIALLSQTLREWSAETTVKMQCVAVCSDAKVSKRKDDSDDISTRDLAYPATTDAQTIADRARAFETVGHCDVVVVFSTYQSLQAIHDAQALRNGLAPFDLAICDEAHRTTGATLAGQDESYFVRIHDNDFIRVQKRLYMTATPRLYGDGAKQTAKENDVAICSMDDPDLYGREFYRLGFGEAVGAGLLADYRVMVLAVDEKAVSKAFQYQLADDDNELRLEDAIKITGCWNGLAKRMVGSNASDALDGRDMQPMRRAVAFAPSIAKSEAIVRMFSALVDEYVNAHPDDETILRCELDHVDGTQNALERHAKLNWLKAETDGNVCRILSNVRCLSEGVDVPALDAVMFLSPRGSVVDVVQSVGRVMRKAPGKQYGYIILPIGIPVDMTPEAALSDHKRYRVVWQVLQALRAHDDRFNATVNKIELNQSKPPQIEVIGVGEGPAGETETVGGKMPGAVAPVKQLAMQFPNLEEWRDAIYAKIVQKCGDRRYWEQWAGDVAQIADGHIARITGLLEGGDPKHRSAFDGFLKGLRENINPQVTEAEAIEMLAQHLITKPVFDALFEGYAFTERNPVSLVMQSMLDVLEGESLAKDTARLEKFYDSVRQRASGIDNATGRQQVIIELYEKFFRGAFPRTAERLGIVYTPVEVVDFIVKSADFALRQEFGLRLTDEGIDIIEPFVGTGTFIVRLLQNGLIERKDLERKFKYELHANEIILLAYYIAAVNIEETYHSITQSDYQPFDGIVLTDTFQMFERKGTFLDEMFPENNARVQRQKARDIRVVIGNPPYSAGQGSENDNNKNLKYGFLDSRIEETYARFSSATLKNSLYASEIRALRWASDRLENKGILCYVTNAAFIDGKTADGVRKCIEDEFTSAYIFNLRGNARLPGTESREREGRPLFDVSGFGGSRLPIAIVVLIKNPEKLQKCQINYYDIINHNQPGKILRRKDKLNIIEQFGDIASINWTEIAPNDSHDWINQRDPGFDLFVSLSCKDDSQENAIFEICSSGINTSRDPWCYNFSQSMMREKMQGMINFYNQEVKRIREIKVMVDIEKVINTDSTKISWTRFLKRQCERGKVYEYDDSCIVKSVYRPFCKQFLYFDRAFSEFLGQIPKFFPSEVGDNKAICVTGIGSGKIFDVSIVNTIPQRHLHGASTACQFFPLYTYTLNTDLGDLFQIKPNDQNQYTRNENIPDTILTEFRTIHNDPTITKEDIFYYVYGILHSPEYKTRFASDLKKRLPRIPHSPHFRAFSDAGRNLAHWHLNYETIDPYPLDEFKDGLFVAAEDYKVNKMTFARNDKTTIIYNSKIKLAGIPLQAYEYKICDRSAIEWIMDRYQIRKDKDSGIVNDPNQWSDDPHYIVDLVKRIVRVSLETVAIVKSLPAINERKP